MAFGIYNLINFTITTLADYKEVPIRMTKKLINLIDKKIEQLERFNEITSQILYEDIDGVGQLIEERQKIVTIVDGISLDIKQFISEQAIERQDQINAVLKFQDIGILNGELLELQEKIKEQNKLKLAIQQTDNLAVSRLKAMQDELLVEMGVMSKTKKVVNYFSSATIDLSKGSKFNISN